MNCRVFSDYIQALYGLQSSSKMWHDKFSDVLHKLDFMPSYNNPDIWMRQNGDNYKYVTVYVNNPTFVLKESEVFLSIEGYL